MTITGCSGFSSSANPLYNIGNNLTNNQVELNNNGQVNFISESDLAIELSTPEEIVEKVRQQERREYQEEAEYEGRGRFKLAELVQDDSLNKLYLKFERWIRGNGDKIPTWKAASPLHYGMSLKKMENVIKQKFKDMISSGHLMQEKTLNQNYNRASFYPETGRGNDNMTRIWGAEFINSYSLGDTTLNAADHFLIVDDETTEIEVKVLPNVIGDAKYPCLSTVKNAHILSKKIEGGKAASLYKNSSKLDKLRYRDFKDPGNIIIDSRGFGWVVDTEIKSFDPPVFDTHFQSIAEYQLFLKYIQKRFQVLCGNNQYPTFKIAVSDIGLT